MKFWEAARLQLLENFFLMSETNNAEAIATPINSANIFRAHIMDLPLCLVLERRVCEDTDLTPK